MIKRVLTFSDTIHAVHGGMDGLWIAHQGGVTHFDPRHGTASKWTTADGLPALPVLHVASDAERVAVATPNGVAWCDDVRDLVRDGATTDRQRRWQHGLAHPDGAGAFVHGVAFVRGRIHAASGAGRLYREGPNGFELVEVPLKQARLTRLVPLATERQRLRVLVLTNNGGILLLATGEGEEPSLYQWSEDEGLRSRYATALAIAGEHVVAAVRGGLHVAPLGAFVDAPEALAQWGRIEIDETAPAGEGVRVAALAADAQHLWIGTTAGLHRLPLALLATAAGDVASAERVHDTGVRHIEVLGGELWIVQGSALGRWRPATSAVEVQAGNARAPLRARFFRVRTPRGAGAAGTAPQSDAPRFVPDARWRGASEPECRQILALAASPEELAAGGEAGRVAFLHGGRWTTESVARLRRPPELHALAWDPEDSGFWAATRFGLYQRDARGRWHRDLAFPGRNVHALLAWGGSLAALGTAGLHLYVQGEWNEVTLSGERPALGIGAASDAALALWGRTSGLHVWRAGAPRPEPAPIGAGRATCMTWGEGGELWIGTDRGILRWDGTRTTAFAWGDERRDRVTAVLEHRGTLYVGSYGGVWAAPVRALRGAMNGDALEAAGERMRLLDGLPDAHVTAATVHDSRVWIGTPAGLVVLE
jgi:hypothetical protein